jgi:hypothetical protein
MPKYSDSLRGYGHPIHEKNNFKCFYCGFDGRSFPNWLQLTVDHVVPRSSGGSENDDNKVTACQACNSITSRMKFPRGTTFEEAVEQKKQRIRSRQIDYFQFWQENVAPRYLDRWNSKNNRQGFMTNGLTRACSRRRL